MICQMRWPLFLFLATLGGCASAPEQPASSFNPSEVAFARVKGVAVVKGQLFLKRNDGVVVYGAGSDVALYPKGPHTEQAVAVGFAGSKVRNEHGMFTKPLTFDPAVDAFVRRTKADGQGNFSFDGVPPGSYYVLGKVSWCAPSQYGCLPQGGDLFEVVTVSPAEKSTTVLLSGT